MNDRGHRKRSIVANGIHLWECSRCGLNWLSGQQPANACPDDPEQRGYARGFAQGIAFANARQSHRDPDPQEPN